MAYVSVPKDLTKVKNKVAFNLTKRQIICIGIGAAIGIPFFFSHKRNTWDVKCGYCYGDFDVTGIYVCHV